MPMMTRDKSNGMVLIPACIAESFLAAWNHIVR